MDPEAVERGLHAQLNRYRRRAKIVRWEMYVLGGIFLAVLLLAAWTLAFRWPWGILLGFTGGASLAAAYFSGLADGRLRMAEIIHRHDHERGTD